MALLQDFVNGDQSFESLDLVGEDRLNLHAGPEGLGGLVVPGIDDTASYMFALGGGLVIISGFLDVDGKLGFGPVMR